MATSACRPSLSHILDWRTRKVFPGHGGRGLPRVWSRNKCASGIFWHFFPKGGQTKNAMPILKRKPSLCGSWWERRRCRRREVGTRRKQKHRCGKTEKTIELEFQINKSRHFVTFQYGCGVLMGLSEIKTTFRAAS